MEHKQFLVDLSNEDIEYLVVGGVAVILHGYIRNTFDLDLLINLKDENLRKIIPFLEQKKYKPKVPVPLIDILDSEKRRIWHEEKGMTAFMLYNEQDPMDKLDLLIYYGDLDFDDAYKRKKVIDVANGQIYIASIDDLIKLKQIAGRGKDLLDINILRELKEQEEDGLR